MDKYEIIKHIGRGSFGEVYTAKRKADGKIVVLKSISRVKDRQYNSAKSEIAIMKELDHPNIVKLYDDFMNEDKVVLCMEYVPGGDLQKLIVSHKNASTRISEEKIWQYLTEITMGLAYMHSKHMLHRDIKPENVLLTESGTSKLTDFGAGKIIEAGKMTETTIGTDFYLSPEVIGFQPYNEETDIWSLGVTIYELAALKRPYVGDNKFCILRLIKQKRPDPLPAMYSQELAALIDLMLVEDPTKRISAAGILRHPRVVQERKALALKKLGYEVDPASPTRAEEEKILEIVSSPLAGGMDVFETLKCVIPGIAGLLKEAKVSAQQPQLSVVSPPSSSGSQSESRRLEVETLRGEMSGKDDEIRMLREELAKKENEIKTLRDKIERLNSKSNGNDDDKSERSSDEEEDDEGEMKKMSVEEEEGEEKDEVEEGISNGHTKNDSLEKSVKTSTFRISDEDLVGSNDVDGDDKEVHFNIGPSFASHTIANIGGDPIVDEMEEVSIPIGGLKTQPIDPDEGLLEILTNSGSNNTIHKQSGTTTNNNGGSDESITGKKSWNHQKRTIIGNYFSTPKKKMASPASPIASPSSTEKVSSMSAEYLGLVPPLKPGSTIPTYFFWKKHEAIKVKSSSGYKAKNIWDNKDSYKLEKPLISLRILVRFAQQQHHQQQQHGQPQNRIKFLYVKQFTSSGMEKAAVSELGLSSQSGEAEGVWLSYGVSCKSAVVEFRIVFEDAVAVDEVVVVKGLEESGSRGKIPAISFNSTAPSAVFSPSGSKKKF